MFLFIILLFQEKDVISDLNTSHVLIYRFYAKLPRADTEFKYISCSYLSYPQPVVSAGRLKFKYISCSYLSLTFQVKHQRTLNLNTSHVLIYPGDTIPAGKSLEFKYISCSYLSVLQCGHSHSSNNLNTSHVLIYLFLTSPRRTEDIDLNTSHVLIYRFVVSFICPFFDYLNTSHVLIYLCSFISQFRELVHLNTSHVLIYRGYTLYKTPPLPQFKYISCSYLSFSKNLDVSSKNEFKYISCSYLSEIRCIFCNEPNFI